jgi:hypothetical protein
MPFLNYECDNGHQFEKESKRSRVKCPECGSPSEILWVSPKSPHRQLQTPIVMWKYADGSLGVAGGADSKTPKNAERVEIRSVGEYRRYAKELNSQMKSREDKREERFLESREKMEKHFRSNLAWMMSQESDPVAKDIYREALEYKSNRKSPTFGEFFSVAMEMDRSNYE